MGVLRVQGCVDCRQNTVRVAKHIVVPKAQHPVAFALDQLRSSGIDSFIMLPAVDLDNQPDAVACEVDDILAERDLSPEARAGEILPQEPPHQLLSVRRIAAQAARAQNGPGGREVFHLVVLRRASPSPNPLPSRERALL